MTRSGDSDGMSDYERGLRGLPPRPPQNVERTMGCLVFVVAVALGSVGMCWGIVWVASSAR